MNKIFKSLSVAVLGIAAVACGSPEKMARMEVMVLMEIVFFQK